MVLANHYVFEPVACTTASGWEKGQVENQVGNIREWLFTPLARFANFEALNQWLAQRCRELAARKHPVTPERSIAACFGRGDVAEAIEKAGLLDGQRAIAIHSPTHRAQAERTGIDLTEVQRLTNTAWAASQDGPTFASALAQHGLALAQGYKVPVILDQTGGVHPLTRILASVARAQGTEPVRTIDVNARLMGMQLPSVDDARTSIRNADGNGQLVAAIPTTQPEPETPNENPVPLIIQEPPCPSRSDGIQGKNDHGRDIGPHTIDARSVF